VTAKLRVTYDPRSFFSDCLCLQAISKKARTAAAVPQQADAKLPQQAATTHQPVPTTPSHQAAATPLQQADAKLPQEAPFSLPQEAALSLPQLAVLGSAQQVAASLLPQSDATPAKDRRHSSRACSEMYARLGLTICQLCTPNSG
jgi:hypothetical protein